MAETAEIGARYVNRELSWLAFNERVLEEAADSRNPLLERLRFLTIFHTNLDEFFMIRVSGVRQQVLAGIDVLTVDGLSPRMQLSKIQERVEPLVRRAATCLSDVLLPELAAAGIDIVHYSALKKSERKRLDHLFLTSIYPMLTPLAVGPTHPFPFISNLSLNLAVMVSSPEGERRFARVKVPLANVPRLIDLSDGETTRLLPLEEVIAANLSLLFPGMNVGKPHFFRVTRDADMEIRADEADDLLDTLQQELRKRRFGESVRLEVSETMPEAILSILMRGLSLEASDVTAVNGLLAVPRLDQLLQLDRPELKFPPFVPRRAVPSENLFSQIRTGDILLHHPFDSFGTVVDFIRGAANDPAVVAIKQTLYRTSGDSPVIGALEMAVENGKQVAAIVELKARFDEENNIVWAQRLEEAGVHVVYGVPGLKTHSKLALVVRREGDDLIRYAHVGTGNYNPNTARVYTDLGLLTAHPKLTSEVARMFNALTGFARPNNDKLLLVAPRHMKTRLTELIAREAEHARSGRGGSIIAKCNAVADGDIIDALYEASGAGASVHLLVRGICSLLPGVKGLSENIDVRSVVGRFLEHNRVYWFANGGDPQVFIGSADWMDRNLERRVEVLTPILAPAHKTWIRDVFLERYLTDTGRTRQMQPDGSYRRLEATAGELDVHQLFMGDRQ